MAKPVEREVVVYREFPSTLVGAQEIEIRARVQGILSLAPDAPEFAGQKVEKGTQLFEIEPETYRQATLEIEAQLAAEKGKPVPMNIDGATAVIFCELGFPAPLARGLFCLSRSVGILAHGWEQMQQGGRNKGPMPPRFLPDYDPDA